MIRTFIFYDFSCQNLINKLAIKSINKQESFFKNKFLDFFNPYVFFQNLLTFGISLPWNLKLHFGYVFVARFHISLNKFSDVKKISYIATALKTNQKRAFQDYM